MVMKTPGVYITELPAFPNSVNWYGNIASNTLGSIGVVAL